MALLQLCMVAREGVVNEVSLLSLYDDALWAMYSDGDKDRRLEEGKGIDTMYIKLDE